MKTDYGATVELDVVTSAMFRDMAEGRTTKTSRLREFPEGRNELAKMLQEERRNTPVNIRRLPSLMGRAASETIDALIIKTLRSCNVNRHVRDYPALRSDMKINLPPVKGASLMEMVFPVDQDGNGYTIKVTDEGGGAFVILSGTDSGEIRFDPAELTALAKWVEDACRDMDKMNASQKGAENEHPA